MTKPNVNKLLEVLLLCNGFSDVKNLAEKIVFFFQVILNEVRRVKYQSNHLLVSISACTVVGHSYLFLACFHSCLRNIILEQTF
jgi:hypothetical protein